MLPAYGGLFNSSGVKRVKKTSAEKLELRQNRKEIRTQRKATKKKFSDSRRESRKKDREELTRKERSQKIKRYSPS
jgi:hypothetical protein